MRIGIVEGNYELEGLVKRVYGRTVCDLEFALSRTIVLVSYMYAFLTHIPPAP